MRSDVKMQRNTKARGKLKLSIMLILVLSLALCLSSCKGKEEGSMEVTEFTFSHNGMSRYDCYEFTVEKTSEGALLTMQPFGGAKIGRTRIDAGILDRLSQLAKTHNMKAWDGFDKTNSNILDGSGFNLSVTFEDGRAISASGSNAMPKGYWEALPDIEKVFTELQELYPGWMGEYSFFQIEDQMFFDYKLIIEEDKTAEGDETSYPFEKKYTGVLTGDGFQTMDRMKVRIEDGGGIVAVVLDEYLPDNMYESFKPGDVLFRLKPEGERIYTKWEKMTPNLPLPKDAKPEEWSVCFVAEN